MCLVIVLPMSLDTLVTYVPDRYTSSIYFNSLPNEEHQIIFGRNQLMIYETASFVV